MTEETAGLMEDSQHPAQRKEGKELGDAGSIEMVLKIMRK